MKVSSSFLSIKDNFEENVLKLANSQIDYIHFDIMDGIFVPIKTWEPEELNFLKGANKPLDIHLMVSDVFTYVDKFKEFKPEYITFHAEATTSILSAINYIKLFDIKAGIAINPGTEIDRIYPYLEEVDLVLVMSVNPGYGGQDFIDVTSKINDLKVLRSENDFNYKIEVDGGINKETIKSVINADIVVSGSFITTGNIEENINKLKKG